MTISIDPLTAAVTFIMTVVLIAVAWWQLAGMNKTSRATLLDQLNGRWSSPTVKAARRALFGIIAAAERQSSEVQEPERRRLEFRGACAKALTDARTGDPATYGEILDLWGFFETLGYAAKRGYVDKKDVLEIYGAALARVWDASQPHIADYRPVLGAEQDQGAKLLEHFTWLADEAAIYLRPHQSGT